MYYFYNITTVQGLKITDPSGVVQPFMGRVGNEGVDMKLDASRFSYPVTVLSHCGEFNKVSIKYMLGKQRIPQSSVFLQTF